MSQTIIYKTFLFWDLGLQLQGQREEIQILHPMPIYIFLNFTVRGRLVNNLVSKLFLDGSTIVRVKNGILLSVPPGSLCPMNVL